MSSKEIMVIWGFLYSNVNFLHEWYVPKKWMEKKTEIWPSRLTKNTKYMVNKIILGFRGGKQIYASIIWEKPLYLKSADICAGTLSEIGTLVRLPQKHFQSSVNSKTRRITSVTKKIANRFWTVSLSNHSQPVSLVKLFPGGQFSHYRKSCIIKRTLV